MGYFQVRYDSRGVNYDRRGFIRLATGLVVMGDDSCFKDRGFEPQCHKLDGHFFTLICCKKLYCLFEKTVKNEKEAGVGPFF